ncbi:bifunctional nuclease family protein [soil metagenome]
MFNSEDVVQVDIFGLSLTPYKNGGGLAVILKEVAGTRRLPIIIGQYEAQAIALELEGNKQPRPLTHDLMRDIIKKFGFAVNYITITELRESTFFAKIKIEGLPDDEEIDARPSDAIAIALKFSAPIYVASWIMDEVSFIPENDDQIAPKDEADEYSEEDDDDFDNIEEKPEKEISKSLSAKERKIIQLKSELEEAVTKEDYEKAARLRDAIAKLDISQN